MSRSLWRLAAVGVLAVGLHAALLLTTWSRPARFLSPPDSREYLAIAANLRQGRGFSQADQPPYEPDFLRTPVYPVVLALLPAASTVVPSGASSMPALVRQATLLNVLIGLGTLVGVALLILRRYGATAALWTAGLLATDLTSLTFHTLVLTETLFTALVCVAVVILTSPRPLTAWRAAASGLWMGAAVLCRPIALLLAPALLPLFLLRRREAGWAAVARVYIICNVVAALCAGAWVVRNVAEFGEASLTSVGGVNLYLHRAAYVEAERSGEPVEVVRQRLADEFDRQTRGLSAADRTRWLEREGEARILAHPLAYITQHLRGVARMLGPEQDDLLRLLGEAPAGWLARLIVMVGLLHLALVYGGVLGAVVRWPRDPLVVAALALLVYMAAIGGPEMYARFRMPLMPLLAAAAGVLASHGRLSRS